MGAGVKMCSRSIVKRLERVGKIISSSIVVKL